MLNWTYLTVTKRTDSQQKVLQISSGLAFDAVLDIRAIELPVGVEHCKRGDTWSNVFTLRQPSLSEVLLSVMDALFTSVFWRVSPLLTTDVCFNHGTTEQFFSFSLSEQLLTAVKSVRSSSHDVSNGDSLLVV